jgi:hypothetical protein
VLPNLRCPNLAQLKLQPAECLGDLGGSFAGSLTSLCVQGALGVDDLRCFTKLQHLEARLPTNDLDTWSDAHTEAISRDAPLTTLRIACHSGPLHIGVTRLPLHVAWRHSLTDLDVSHTNFAAWQSLAGFTALRCLNAVYVWTTWADFPAAFPALGGLEELAFGNNDNMPAAVHRQRARVTRHVRRHHYVAPMDDDGTIYNCIRDHWNRLERVYVSKSADTERLLEELQPKGVWEVADSDHAFVWKATRWASCSGLLEGFSNRMLRNPRMCHALSNAF